MITLKAEIEQTRQNKEGRRVSKVLRVFWYVLVGGEAV